MAYLEDTPSHDPPRPKYRAPVGIPVRDEGRRAGALISVLVHAVIIGLLIVPFFLPSSVIERVQQGAGGPGHAGGGGGGSAGARNGPRETLRYVRIAPDPVATPRALPTVPVPPVPVPKVEPPKPMETPPKPQEQAAAPQPSTTVAAAEPGGGSGRDGSAGAGPGSGGGIGSGVGTGTGSSNGPGTGGGVRANYDPTPVQFFLPPLPPPANVRGFRFTAEFDVDSTGRVVDYQYTRTPNGSYNRSLDAVLRAIRFRPGVRPDGTPVRMKAQISYDF